MAILPIAFSIHILEVANQIPWKNHGRQEGDAVRHRGSVMDHEADKLVWRSNIGGFSCPAKTSRAYSIPGYLQRHCPDPFSFKQHVYSTLHLDSYRLAQTPMSPEPVGWVDRELSLYQKSKERLVHLAYSELRDDLVLKPRGRSFLSALVFSLLLPLFTCSPPWLPSVTVTDDWTRIRRESWLPTAPSSENGCQRWIRNHGKQPWPLGKEREHMSFPQDKPLRTPILSSILFH